MNFGALETIRQQLTCQLCHHIYTNPHCFSCKHNFCEKCIQQILQQRNPQCVECSMPQQPHDVSRNQFLNDIVLQWHNVDKEYQLQERSQSRKQPHQLRQSLPFQSPNSTSEPPQTPQRTTPAPASRSSPCSESDAMLLLQMSAKKAPSPGNTPDISTQDIELQEANVEKKQSELEFLLKRKRKSPAGESNKENQPLMQFTLAASNLTPQQLKEIVWSVKKLGGRFHPDIRFHKNSPQVVTTHLITKWTDLKRKRCKRTIKYALGIAAGIWIVDYSWIVDSLKANMWLSEEKYEITGDDTFEGRGAPCEARENRARGDPPIFSSLHCFLVGKFAKPDIDRFDLQRLIQVAGGQVQVACMEKLPESMSVDVILASRDITESSASSLHHKYRVPVLHYAWVLDSFSRSARLPFSGYSKCKRIKF